MKAFYAALAPARAGEWSVVFVGYEPVPKDWFPSSLAGVRILCLASGGGQQRPVLAATGAEITVLDNSPQQLARDEEVAVRDGLSINTAIGDMRNLSAFDEASFDVIVNPCRTYLPRRRVNLGGGVSRAEARRHAHDGVHEP